jgi:galactokinase
VPLLSPARLAISLFENHFGSRPAAVASAPGRVNLIGEHMDYNGGPVLPVALQRRTAVAVAPADRWEFLSGEEGGVIERVDPAAPMRRAWTDYLVAVVRELAAVEGSPRGARVAVGTTLTVGAGLSSSAALTVAAAKALSLLARRRLTPAELVDVAFRAEHDQVGVRCGRMDQTIAAHARPGTALLFDTATGALTWLPLRARIWIVDTGISHRLTGGELNRRRAESGEALARLRERWPALRHLAQLDPDLLDIALPLLPPPLARRTRHVVTERVRTEAAARALQRGALDEVGGLMVEGHESLRTDYESTIPEADLVVASAVRHAPWAARLTGAGWGGAVVVLAPPERQARVLAETAREFRERFGRVPEVWGSRAAGGVRRERV